MVSRLLHVCHLFVTVDEFSHFSVSCQFMVVLSHLCLSILSQEPEVSGCQYRYRAEVCSGGRNSGTGLVLSHSSHVMHVDLECDWTPLVSSGY